MCDKPCAFRTLLLQEDGSYVCVYCGTRYVWDTEVVDGEKVLYLREEK